MKWGCALFVSLLLSACGGGGSSGSGGTSTPTGMQHLVTLTWAANREAAVNSPGGGYKVAISGQPTIDVPYPFSLPTPSTTATLPSGNYTATVTAYSSLDPITGMVGSATKSVSLPSTKISITVP